MNRAQFVLAGVRHYWRTQLGVVVGCAIGAAVLTGALLVGDSVRASLREQTEARIGRIDAALAANDRFFREALAAEVAAGAPGAEVAPVLSLVAVASADGGARRANGVFVHGVDARFLAFSPDSGALPPPEPGEVLLSESLARQLGAAAGDSVLLRIEKPSALPRDMILATTEDDTVALRLTCRAVLGPGTFGRFSLAASQVPPYNAFVALPELQSRVELAGRANLLVARGVTPDAADAAVRERWTIEDGELALRPLAESDEVELLTSRIFLDHPVVEALETLSLDEPLVGVLTYFVNAIQAGERSTPYSMVTALAPLADARASWLDELVPGTLADDDIVVNEWLADDLAVAAGDEVQLEYFVPGPDRRLVEASETFRVHSVIPLAGRADDPTWMPEFPGLSDADHCRDWETGVPVDLDAIRDKDEDYWDDHRGTPKAFVTLDEGRRLWASRFGSLTAVRAPATLAESLEAAIEDRVDPAALGLFFQDVSGRASLASRSPTDFGGLFLGLSFFLILSALLLTALFFAFGVEQRNREVGTLLAVGFRPRDVRRLFLYEASVLALVGSVAGAALGTVYTRAVLVGLTSVWQGAVGAAAIAYHASPGTLAAGGFAAFVVALGAVALALRGQARREAVELLASSEGVTAPAGPSPAAGRRSGWVAAVLLLGAVALALTTDASSGSAAAGAFFGAGALVLVAGVLGARAVLARLARSRAAGPRSVFELGIKNGTRRLGRSIATVALLASGTFLVVSIGVHEKSARPQADTRASGTGGFAFVGRSALGLFHDLNTAEGRDAFGLTAEELAGVSVVPFRVRDGDDASCLNLNTPQTPRLLGVDPTLLAERGAFRFAATLEDSEESPWLALRSLDGDPIPAIADQASVQWTMKRKLGDVLEYTDERGRPMPVRIVATLADSVLQGDVIVAEELFRDRFPSEPGYRRFLVDAPFERRDDVSQVVTRALSDQGLELVPAEVRLAEFNAVQNTYLAIFQVLGALGVLLGSVGLGVVVLRNALERRRELAIVRAVGFPKRALRWLLVSEHALLVLLGLLSGALAAWLALVPAATDAGGATPFAAGPLVVALAVNGLVWVVVAASVSARGSLVDALRHE